MKKFTRELAEQRAREHSGSILERHDSEGSLWFIVLDSCGNRLGYLSDNGRRNAGAFWYDYDLFSRRTFNDRLEEETQYVDTVSGAPIFRHDGNYVRLEDYHFLRNYYQ